MTSPDAPTGEARQLAEIDREARAALAAIPDYLRHKQRTQPRGSTRPVFSDAPRRTTHTRKA